MMVTDEIYETEVEIMDGEAVTLHVAEPDYSLVFGTKFDERGDLIFQQFYKNKDRVFIDTDDCEAHLI